MLCYKRFVVYMVITKSYHFLMRFPNRGGSQNVASFDHQLVAGGTGVELYHVYMLCRMSHPL